ncbi:MBL fold metallo-hydrolase [Roseitranquillus sediminis]|uniref:MBL fold metallo-hydrolase n=1 Tax=Roseitranquillus sediminis TaxID=2809051 RepID=UPI001D0C233A|nr:MBL fold metallo-hydrolase [Roseitranquillus sediminis]MBM9592981.1 MBL fold metallo-hydrolase [Roseitranquillus sediminis]
MVEWLEPNIRRLLAPNPSPMTLHGTNGYIVGRGRVAVIDPGPDDPRHLAAWQTALAGEVVTHILVTHAHSDHSPLAPALAAAHGAPVLGFGPPTAGRSSAMRRLAEGGFAGGGEGADPHFRPDRRLADGERVEGPDWSLEVLHLPGHFAGHLGFALGDAVFTGDHVMAWSSTLISPPDGDIPQFMASCERLKSRRDRIFYPGHGEPVTDPVGRIDWLVAHRRERERQVLDALDRMPGTAEDLAQRIYADLSPVLLPAAGRNVLAHLIDLTERQLVVPDAALGHTATFRSVAGPRDRKRTGRPDPLLL